MDKLSLLDSDATNSFVEDRHMLDPLFLGVVHVKDGQHVSVRHDDEHLEVADRGVQFEVIGNSAMNHDWPFGGSVLDWLASRKANPIPPLMVDLPERILIDLVARLIPCSLPCIDELVVEYVCVGLDVYAWHLLVVVLLSEHEIRVKLDSAVFPENSTHHVAFALLSLAVRIFVLVQR